MSVNNLIVILLVIMLIGIVFLSTKRRIELTVLVSMLTGITMLYIVKLPFLINTISIVFILLLLIWAFKISRDIIYIGAIFFILCSAVFLQLQFELPAKFSGTLSFFLLCIGVAKDILYEKTFSK